MSKLVIVAETGSDISKEMAKEKNIQLVPMHIAMGGNVLDDGSFPPGNICMFYEETGVLPKTSGCSPDDFTKTFDFIHRQWPEKKILHLAYSAVTTCSYQSALLAAEGRDYVMSVDTKHVSAGQGAIVIQMAELLEQNPDLSLQEAAAAAAKLIASARMCFLPSDLNYLRAGGRVSNAKWFAGKILGIRPRIEVIDGVLIATKKHRGKMEKLVSELVHAYSIENNLHRDRLWLIRSVGLSEKICHAAEQAASVLQYKVVSWVDTGCVITTHGGPGAFGIVGFAKP